MRELNEIELDQVGGGLTPRRSPRSTGGCGRASACPARRSTRPIRGSTGATDMREFNELEVEAVGGGYWVPPPKDAGGIGEGSEPWPGKPSSGGTYP